NSSRWAATTGPTNDGTPCWGSPTARLMAGLPGGVSPKSSRSRTNGERPISARAGEAEGTRSTAGMDIDTSGASTHRPRDVLAHVRDGGDRVSGRGTDAPAGTLERRG